MFAGKPIIGIAGGIGSGKSFIAHLFEELGGHVISSDAQAHAVYADPRVCQILRQWWGDQAFSPGGQINRSFIASRVFNDPAERKRLEELIHPLVHDARRRAMDEAAKDPRVTAFIWDTPLLFETGLHAECDAVVYVDASPAMRLGRVQKTRNWQADELNRREFSQWPLDKKRKISDYVISNTADVGDARGQVTDVFSRILTKAKQL